MKRALSIVNQAARAVKAIRVLPAKGTPQRLVALITFAVSLTIVFPFAFWFLTWHGWALDPGQVENGFAEPIRPGRASRQIIQIAEKLSRGDHSPRRWYPRILELARSQHDELRRNVAWMMGKDPGYAGFHQPLRVLLHDPVPLVRLEAALSLAEFRDAAARDELNASLAPLRVQSSIAGRLQLRIDVADTTKPQTVVARINDIDMIAGIPGTVTHLLVKDGENVSKGQALVAIDPTPSQKQQVRRALRLLDHP